LSDNYMYILIDQKTNACAVVDPVEPEKLLKRIADEGAKLTTILTTHHHYDHAGMSFHLDSLHSAISSTLVTSTISWLVSVTTPSGMPHLTCGTSFLLLFMFLISSILHHRPALLHRHTLILDRLLTSFVAFSILEVFPFIAIYLFLRLISWNYDQSLFDSYCWR